MINTRVVVHQSASAEEAGRASLALVAMGLEADTRRVQHFVDGDTPTAAAALALPSEADAAALRGVRPVRIIARTFWQVCVDEGDADSALAILAEALAPEETIAAPAPAPFLLGDPSLGIWTARNAASSIAVAALCIGVHMAVHRGDASSARSAMIEAGAIAPWLVNQGQWWRLASAVFLHFDLQHLVGNMSSLLFLGPPLAAETGHVRLVVLFVATGVFGNIVSQFLGDEVAIRAGASGGICGLLGALAGVALAQMAGARDSRERRPAWQTLGALAALFGMIVGFEPGHDHYAHVGGVVAGVLLGRILGLRPRPSGALP